VSLIFILSDKGAISLAGGDQTLIKPQAIAMLHAGALAGEYYTATNTDGELVGFSLWMPPGQEMFSRYVNYSRCSLVTQI